jgi:uncharacterized membrane protein YciS (DUF1049 family)
MNFASEASKLLTNKYFLYFISFLAVTNVMGYIVTNKVNAVIFFALVCILMFNFSKNMTVVLIVAIVATNLLMANKSIREGMESGTVKDAVAEKKAETTDTTTTDDTTTADSDNQEEVNAAAVTSGVKAFKEAGGEVTPETKEKIETKLSTNTTVNQAKEKAATSTANAKPATTDEAFTPAGTGFSGKKRGAIGGPAKVSRIDYSTTLEQAYDNLDKMLGSDGLNNLTADTEKLMAQQQKLFTAVNSMMPMIDKAQGMIQGLDMDKINSLVGMTGKFGNLGSK